METRRKRMESVQMVSQRSCGLSCGFDGHVLKTNFSVGVSM